MARVTIPETTMSRSMRVIRRIASRAVLAGVSLAVVGIGGAWAQPTSGTANGRPFAAGNFGSNRGPGMGPGGSGGGGMRAAMQNMTPEERRAAMEKFRQRRQARMAAAPGDGTTSIGAAMFRQAPGATGDAMRKQRPGKGPVGFGNPAAPVTATATAAAETASAPKPAVPAAGPWIATAAAPKGREALRQILETFTPEDRAAARAYLQGLNQDQRQGLGARMKRTPQEQRPEFLKALVKSGKPPTTVEDLRTRVGLAAKVDLGPPLTIAAKESGTGDYRRSGAGAAGAIPLAGSPAPDLKLPKAEGAAMLSTRPSSGTGRPLVVALGSITSPAYRARIPEFARMLKTYGTKADFLLIYTTEAHPSGSDSPFADREWVPEKNRDEKVTPPQPTTMAARQALAMETRSRFGETLPIAVDGLDNAAWKAFGARADAAFLIGADGKVAIAQERADPEALETALSKL